MRTGEITSFWIRLTRWRSLVRIFAGIALLIAVVMIHHQLRNLHYHEMVAALKGVPISRVFLALLMTMLAYTVLTFYDTLGLRFLFQAPPGLAFFDCSGVRLMLDAPARAGPRPRRRNFRVATAVGVYG